MNNISYQFYGSELCPHKPTIKEIEIKKSTKLYVDMTPYTVVRMGKKFCYIQREDGTGQERKVNLATRQLCEGIGLPILYASLEEREWVITAGASYSFLFWGECKSIINSRPEKVTDLIDCAKKLGMTVNINMKRGTLND